MNNIVDAYGSERRGYPKINLNHVARFVPSTDGKSYECFTAAGDSLGVIGSYHLRENAPLAVVPETRNTTLIQFWFYADVLSQMRLPVIAWAVYASDHVLPICCDEYEGANTTWCLETEGQWIFPEDRTCNTLEDAAAYAREQLQRREARRGLEREQQAALKRASGE